MKIAYKVPSNVHIAYYRDFEGLSGRLQPPVQIYCKRLIEAKTDKKQLWVYNNLDTKQEHLPDQIYPSIRGSAQNAMSRVLSMGEHYGSLNKKQWGLPGQDKGESNELS